MLSQNFDYSADHNKGVGRRHPINDAGY